MQATIDAFALKPFVRALQCLSRYGDDLLIHATPQTMSLSSTSSSMSAYCRYMWDRQFFVRYSIGIAGKGKGKEREMPVDEPEDVPNVTGQLMVKSLLSILKHKTVEKTAEKCELLIFDAPGAGADGAGDEDDTLASVVKTHRLTLHNTTSLVAPNIPPADEASHVTMPARTVKDMLEHFPNSRYGAGGKGDVKSDPQLVWTFEESDVNVKSFEIGADVRGKAQLNTELKISIDEFDAYDLAHAPAIIAFHLREFNATIAFAESLSLSLTLHFTTSTAPLFIDIDGGDGFEALFVISTSTVGAQLGRSASRSAPVRTTPLNGRKRAREDDAAGADTSVASVANGAHGSAARATPARAHPQWAVHRTDSATHARLMASAGRSSAPPSSWPGPGPANGTPGVMGPPLPPPRFSQASAPGGDAPGDDGEGAGYMEPFPPAPPSVREPLFLPSSQASEGAPSASQTFAPELPPALSQLQLDGAAELEGLDDAALAAFIDDDADSDLELQPDGTLAVLSSQRQSERELLSVAAPGTMDRTNHRLMHATSVGRGPDFDELVDDEEIAPTQSNDTVNKTFRPLFED